MTSLLRYEKNSYGHVFKIESNGSIALIEKKGNPEFDAWLLVSGEPPLNTELDLKGPIPPGVIPPTIAE